MSQSLSQLWVHVIFSTKKRCPFLNDSFIQKRMYGYIKEICESNHCNVMSIGGIADHVHLLVSLNKNIALSDLIEKIKKSSSKWIKKLDAPNNQLNQFYWQNGYGAFSVSQSNLKMVVNYIKNQQKHHEKQSFQDELRKLFLAHDVAYKEEYVWD